MNAPSSDNNEVSSEARRALDRACLIHLPDPNVSLVDLGYRIRDRQGYKIEREICVRVHLRRKLFGDAFNAYAARHPERVPRADRIGFAVDVPEAPYRTQLGHPWSWDPTAIPGPRGTTFSPMLGGIGVSSVWGLGSGTLGGKVIDRTTKTPMMLSNWHVLAGWYARPGAAIYQPTQWGTLTFERAVAQLTRHALDQFMDAAVAELTGTRPLVNDQLELAPVTGVTAPRLDMPVTKSGYGSAVTTGIITGIEGRRVEYYQDIPQVIRHIVHVAPSPAQGEVSRKGDSGSWWIEAGTQRAVALHFAGSNFPEYGLGIAMPQVLDALGVYIATEV